MGVTTDKLEILPVAQGEDGWSEAFIDVADFFDRVLEGYEDGTGPANLEADLDTARSLIPVGTGAYRDFSHLAPEIPLFTHENCVGCMTCVTECPDTAILGKVVEEQVLEERLGSIDNPDERAFMQRQFAETTKYYTRYERQGEPGGKFDIFIDPTKCKGCAECVEVCVDLGYNALKMIPKEDETVPIYQKSIDFFRALPETPERYIQERIPADMMLAEESMLYVGGAGSCAGPRPSPNG